MQDGGNPQARLLHQKTLDRIAGTRRVYRCERAGAPHARDLADTIAKQLAHFHPGRVVLSILQLVVPVGG